MINENTIDEYLDGELNETQQKEFAQWLLASPKHRTLFHQEVAFAAALSDESTAMYQSETSTSTAPTSQPHTLSPSGKHRRITSLYRRSQRARSINFAAIASVAAVLVIALAVALQSTASTTQQTLKINNINGSVTVMRGNVPLKTAPTELMKGDEVILGTDSSLLLEMDAGRTRMFLSENSRVIIAGIKELDNNVGTQLNLAYGHVLVEAAPQPANAPLQIRSARSYAEVVGTILSFSSIAEHDHLVVGHGTVNYGLLNDSHSKPVTIGGYAKSDGGQIVTGTLGFQPPTPISDARVNGFSLIDNHTGMSVSGYTNIINGSVIDLAALRGKKINISADVVWPNNHSGHVVLHYDDLKPIAEASPPYSLISDNTRTAVDHMQELFHNGIHVLVATPYSGKLVDRSNHERQVGGQGDPGHSATLIFTIINGIP